MSFTGRAIYDDSVFTGVAEDVSDLISMISPFETPLLDRLGDAPRPATNVLHEWLEDSLNPNTLVTSNVGDGGTSATSLQVHVGGASITGFLQVGAVLKVTSTGEYLQITAISGEYLTVSREFGGTTADTIAAGSDLFVVSDAALEGADVSGDISRPRSRIFNYTQIFKKDVIVSGTVQAVTHLGGVQDELDYQRTQRLREAVRDLEKAAINGILSGNSIGSSTAYRTMRGIWDYISTNSTSTGTLTPGVLNTVIQGAWDAGGTDLDIIIADANWKKTIDTFNDTRLEVRNRDERYFNRVSFFESTFGVQEVVLGRWMPSNSLMVLSSQRVHVLPLQGRSFQWVPVSRTGDADKGMVIGEYTTEVHNEAGLAKAFG